MSGLVIYAVTAVVVLCCERCPARWESEPYFTDSRARDDRAARPAFDLGWRVFKGERTQHTYCPKHGPTVPMHLVYPERTDR